MEHALHRGGRGGQEVQCPSCRLRQRWRGAGLSAFSILLLFVSTVDAQRGRGEQPTGPPPTPRAAAPIDLTGYWVSLVTDDWRWRMVTPPKGDVLYLPVNAEGRRVAESWDPARDEAAGEQCKGYGAPGLMHLPGRLHITWDNDTTLKVDVDTGMQTRVFHFGADPKSAPEGASWQGYSIAQWEMDGAGARRGRMARAADSRPRRGSLKVVTTRLRPGYFRKNGVPYSADAVLTEYWTTLTDTGTDYLVITKFLEDPQYLAQPYVRSVQYKRQPDAKGWRPTACSAQ
jgi:hypothetical protein